MDGQRFHNSGISGTHNATTPPLDWPQSPPSSSQPRPVLERSSASNLRTTFRSNAAGQNTIRAVTPDMSEREPRQELGAPPPAPSAHPPASSQVSRGFGPASPQTSPRSIPRSGDVARRQGVVFNDSFGASYDSSSSSPPPRHVSGSFRPRTHTMDGSFRQQFVGATTAETRHRVGSFSSSGSQPIFDDVRPPPSLPLETAAHPTSSPSRPSEPPTSAPSGKEKKASGRRLVKRQSSRPTSPQLTTPSVDSLPIPVPTDDANKILLLMKTLCGRMRGEAEYLSDPTTPWRAGVGYVDEDKGSLMFDTGFNGPFHLTLISDLRGCRITPAVHAETSKKCLEIVSASASQPPVELLLHPLVAEECDLWLAALLCWQQLKPPKVKLSNGNRTPTPTSLRPVVRRRASELGPSKPTTSLIKVGQVRLWDKGLATSPRAIVKRPSTRDLRSPSMSWRLVSCLLQDNGEMRLTTNDGDAVIAVIELSQLSRCAIQQLDRSVLDEEYCIAIFPHYSAVSTQLSIFRPVYLALENRLLFEVWFVLLRAFALPDIYRLDSPGAERVVEVLDLEAELPGEVFRVEKTIKVRVTEAKLRPKVGSPEAGHRERHDRHARSDPDPLVGNYMAEVILDGEVRSRTTIKTETKNPFWREESQFSDLPAAMPFLSVILKRVDGNLSTLQPQLQAPTNLSKFPTLSEVLCGSVDIPLSHDEADRESERWLEIHDERQQIVGTMLIRVQYDELIVLHSKEYEALSALLHGFTSGLTVQISRALPGSLRRLSEIFLNVFQVSGSANEWLQALVEDEIDGVGSQSRMKRHRFSSRLKSNESLESASEREAIVRETGKSLAGEANLLFRGNTLFTQALEFHLRRTGKEYLDQMLAAKIGEINELDPNCEVDPSRLKSGEDLQQNWARLLQLTTEIWQCICREPTKCPAELRSMLKYVRAVAEYRYGDFLRTITYTSVSSFLFLRYVCPAILSPKLFGLSRDNPRPRAQRALTLIAKALQALGNLSTFGKKEEWMEPMNKFLNTQRQSLKGYIDAICDIPAERNKVALGPSYSTPITILGRLPPNAREGFPALPHVIDHARNFATLVKLWTDANPLATATAADSTAQSPGDTVGGNVEDDDLLIFNEMCFDLQKRSDACHAKVERSNVADAMSQSASELADVLEHSTLADSINLSYDIQPPIVPGTDEGGVRFSDNVVGGPPGSSGSDVPLDSHRSSRRSREHRRGRETSSSMRHVSAGQADVPSPGGTLKRHNGGRSTRTILSGIMKPFARSESPDGNGSPLSKTH